jgi:uncharacterized protein YrrD
MEEKLKLGATVRGINDKDLGTVKMLVANPNNNEVTHLVVDTGLLDGRKVLVERSWISGVTDDGKKILVNLSEDHLDQLPDFIERDYLVSEDTLENQGAGYTGYVYPAVAGGFVPDYPATASMPAAITGAHQPPMPYVERVNVPENSLIIREGAAVEALDGNVGKVKEVHVDPKSGKVLSFTVEKGFLFTDDYEVPMNMVDSATEDTVRLNIKKSAFESPQL